MLNSAESLIYRFRTSMASSDADDAQADVAQLLRDAARRLDDVNPDRGAEFSDGVTWAVATLQQLADEIDGEGAPDA